MRTLRANAFGFNNEAQMHRGIESVLEGFAVPFFHEFRYDPATQGLHLDNPEVISVHLDGASGLLQGSSRELVNLMLVELGDTWTLTHARFGLAAGKTGLVVSIERDWLKGRATVGVLA